MKNKCLIVASQAEYLKNAHNRARVRQIADSLDGFSCYYVNTNPARRGDTARAIPGIRIIAAGNAKNNGVGCLHERFDLRAIVDLRSFAVVYFDSFVSAHKYVPLIRKIQPNTVIIIDSFLVEELKSKILKENMLPVSVLKPFLKYREMAFSAYRQANLVFVRSRQEKERIVEDNPLLENIFVVPPSGRLPRNVTQNIKDACRGSLRTRKWSATIIIPVYNQLRFTVQCLDSVFTYSRAVDYEIVIIDNGSSDGTPLYLKKLTEKKRNVRIITNKENRGYTRAVNQGIRAAKGDYLVLLNNDTIVHDNWISKLVECLRSDGRIGAVCPALDYAVNGDGVATRPDYRGIRDFHDYAHSFERLYSQVWIEVPFICFRCAVIPRRVVRRMGLLDESLNFNTLQDVAYCFKMRNNGLRLVCRMDVYLHHYGGATFEHTADYSLDGEAGFRRMVAKYGPRMLEYFSHIMGDLGPGFAAVPLTADVR